MKIKMRMMLWLLLCSTSLSIARMNIMYGVLTYQNKRPYQEDRFMHAIVQGKDFFGIYDGHGGDYVSSFLKSDLHDYFNKCLEKKMNTKSAFECAFLTAEDYALKNYDDGSTALAVYIDKNNMLHCAWAGDTRAVLECNGKACFLTQDHKPDRKDEKERIERAGGNIAKLGVWRVNGLAVSRSIGDAESKRGAEGQIIAFPEYAQMQLKSDNHFLILASDGLWDVIDNEEAVEMVDNALRDKKSLTSIVKMLQNAAVQQGSKDNITVCVVTFEWKRDSLVKRFWNWFFGK